MWREDEARTGLRGVAKIKFDKQKLLLLGSNLVNGNFLRKYQFHFLQFLFAISKNKTKERNNKNKTKCCCKYETLFGISCGTSIYTYHRCLHISMYCTYVYVIYTRVNLSFSPKWRRQIRVLERHTKKMKKIIKIMITKNKHKNRQLAIKMSGTTRTRE